MSALLFTAIFVLSYMHKNMQNLRTFSLCDAFLSLRDLGYYPNISSQQLAAVNEMKRLVDSAQLCSFDNDEELLFLKFLRFLRARKFDVGQAFELFKADVHWRRDGDRWHMKEETAGEILQCDAATLFTYFPTWLQGCDKQGRPVSYRQFGKFEIWNIMKLTTMDRLVRFHAWESEMALRLMGKKSRELGLNIETFTVVIDAAGWSLKLATSDAFTFIKGMASTDADHYPERLGTLVVINAPGVLAFAWKVIQGFLDDVTKAKIKILSSDTNEWRPVLLDLIDDDQIPAQYGGLAPDLSPEEAMAAMNPPLRQSELSGKLK